MAAVTTNPISVSSPTNISSPPPQTFLSKCYEQLNLKEADENKRAANMWNIAAKIAPWGFTILAVSCFVSTYFLAASYLPFTGIGILFLMGPAYRFSQYLAASAQAPRLRAAMLTEIKDIFDKLPSDSKFLSEKLSRMGIQWNKIPGVRTSSDLVALKPLLARYKFWKGEMKQHQLLAKETADAANELIKNRGNTAADRSNNYLKLKITPKTFRKSSLVAEQEALEAKVHAAFAYFALQQPNVSQPSQIYTIHSKSYSARALERAFNEPNADTLVEFKKASGTIRNLSVTEVKSDSIQQLANKIAKLSKKS